MVSIMECVIDFSSRRARRSYLVVVATGFLVFGAALTLGFGVTVVRGPSAIACVALLLSLSGLAFGVFQFTSMPYDISISRDAVEFSVLTGSHRVPWADIEWYWPLQFTVGTSANPGLWVLFKYVDRTARGPKPRRALIGLGANGPVFGSIDEFMTDFDQYVPTKRRRGLRHS